MFSLLFEGTYVSGSLFILSLSWILIAINFVFQKEDSTIYYKPLEKINTDKDCLEFIFAI